MRPDSHIYTRQEHTHTLTHTHGGWGEEVREREVDHFVCQTYNNGRSQQHSGLNGGKWFTPILLLGKSTGTCFVMGSFCNRSEVLNGLTFGACNFTSRNLFQGNNFKFVKMFRDKGFHILFLAKSWN